MDLEDLAAVYTVREFKSYLIGENEVSEALIEKWFPKHIFKDASLRDYLIIIRTVVEMTAVEIDFIEQKAAVFVRKVTPIRLWSTTLWTHPTALLPPPPD
jgi:hypothetical protein